MKLSQHHRRVLLIYQEYRRSGVSVATMYRYAWKSLAFLFAYILLVAIVMLVMGLPWVAALIGGMALGALFRDVAYIRQAFRLWPLLSQIINWDRITELLEQDNQLKDKPES